MVLIGRQFVVDLRWPIASTQARGAPIPRTTLLVSVEYCGPEAIEASRNGEMATEVGFGCPTLLRCQGDDLHIGIPRYLPIGVSVHQCFGISAKTDAQICRRPSRPGPERVSSSTR